MKLLDLLYLTLENFKSRKTRVIFTVLGVSIGVGAILFLVSLGFGLQKNLLEKITTQESLLTFDVTPSEAEVVSLTSSVLSEMKHIQGVKRVISQAVFPSQVSIGDFTSQATLNLIDRDYFKLNGTLPQKGRVFGKEGEEEAVVNRSLVSLFNLNENEILGKKLRFVVFRSAADEEGETKIIPLTHSFQVVGVLQAQGENPQAYLNIANVKEVTIKEYQFAKVEAVNSEAMEPVRDKLISMGFLVSALSDTIEQANKIFKIIQVVLASFGIIALIVAAVGLVNTMTISLLERTSEIGIMRAIGASPYDIMWIFLGESTLTGFLGGIAGIGVGIGSGSLFNWLVNIIASHFGRGALQIFYYPLWFILLIVLVSTIVGFIAGIWPARRAAKLNPLEALRYK